MKAEIVTNKAFEILKTSLSAFDILSNDSFYELNLQTFYNDKGNKITLGLEACWLIGNGITISTLKGMGDYPAYNNVLYAISGFRMGNIAEPLKYLGCTNTVDIETKFYLENPKFRIEQNEWNFIYFWINN